MIAAVALAGRAARRRRLEERRVEARDHREHARIGQAKADRVQAEADERSARARREQALAEEQAATARREGRFAQERATRADELDPDVDGREDGDRRRDAERERGTERSGR